MTDPRNPVSRGQRLAIAADQINFLNRLMRGTTGLSGGAIGEGSLSPYVWVFAKNSTGADVQRWEVMEVTGVEVVPTDDDQDAETQQFVSCPVLAGGLISGSTEKWCVALEPVRQGAIGRVAIAGVVQVKKSDLSKLRNAFILWENDDWALVGRGGGDSDIRLGKTSDEWDKHTTATVVTWDNDNAESAGEEIDGCVNKYMDVGAYKWVHVARCRNGLWYLIAAEC